MSALLGHARAARLLGKAYGETANLIEVHGSILHAHAAAHIRAAELMEEAMRQDVLDHPSGCTIDHAKIGVPKCPACGAPRTGR